MHRTSLRICLLFDHAGLHDDEGAKKTARYFHMKLSKSHTVKSLDTRRMALPDFWKEVRAFQPQIVHYIPGPSILSFIAMKALKLRFGNVKTVMSATHPCFYGFQGLSYYGLISGLSSLLKNLIPLLKPDMLLVQSSETEKMFVKLGCKTEFLSCGIDIKKFAPVSKQTKLKLRSIYGVDKRKFVILHVGRLTKLRNVQALCKLQSHDTQVIVVGSTMRLKDDVYQTLRKKGCLVWTEYIPDIDEVYNLSDCYLFPTFDREGCIETPLSVLEAMACNLPVISTKFGGLTRIFTEGEGLYFTEEEQIPLFLDKVKTNNERIQTRAKVLPYTWEKIAHKLELLYVKLLEE